MSVPTSAESLLRLDREQRRLLTVQRILIWLLPILLILVSGDLVQWGVQLQQPIRPLLPDLGPISKPMPAAPTVEFPETLFEPLKTEPPPAPVAPATVERERVWVLKGVIMAGGKRAFLEDSDSGQTLWVREGEQVGEAEVKEIQARTVILMRGDKTFELQM